MPDDERLAGNAEVEARARGRPAAGRDDGPVLVLGAPPREEALALGELVIELDVVGPPILCALEGPFVVRPQPPGVDREELILLRALEGPEDVRPVLDDRPAERPAVLVAPVVRLRRLKELLRRNRGVAEEQQAGSVDLVRAGLRHDRQQAAGREPVLGLVVRRRHLELLDGVHREVLARLAHLGPGVVHPVDDEPVRGTHACRRRR